MPTISIKPHKVTDIIKTRLTIVFVCPSCHLIIDYHSTSNNVINKSITVICDRCKESLIINPT